MDNKATLQFSDTPTTTKSKDDITRHYTFSIDAAYICTYIWASAEFGSWPAIAEAAASFNRRLIGSLVAIIPLAFYNRKLGYHSKWFGWLYSIFYPLQFAVLIIARYFIRGF